MCAEIVVALTLLLRQFCITRGFFWVLRNRENTLL